MGGGQSSAPSKPEVPQSNELRIAMKYQWKLKGIRDFEPATTFVSGMLSVSGEKSLRIWQNTSVFDLWEEFFTETHYSTDMFLGAINLHSKGLKIANVLASLTNEGSSKLMRQINGNDVNTVQVFEAHFCHKYEPLDLLMYAQPLTEDFVYVLRDSSLKNQLWKAHVDGLYDPDVVIRVSGHCLSVHKSILCTRSPLLATKIKPGESSIDFEDVDVLTVEQFLKFLYTGTLDGPFASEKLLLLAKNYKVYTLEKVCKIALEKVDQKEIGKIMSSMRNWDSTNENPLKSVDNIPEAVEIDDSTAIFCCEWVIEKTDDSGATLVSETFVCKEQPLFFVTISPKTSSRYDDEERRLVEEKTSHVSLICCSPCGYQVEKASFYYRVAESKVVGGDFVRRTQKGAYDSFHGSIKGAITAPCTIEFHVKIKNQIKGFTHELVDIKWFEDLSRFHQFGDVEVKCGEKNLKAHRAVICARSPVLHAKLGINEVDKVSAIEIDGVSPEAVEIFLKFLYTGVIPFTALDKRVELEALASKYQVDSLKNWLLTLAQEVKAEDILFSVLSVS